MRPGAPVLVLVFGLASHVAAAMDASGLDEADIWAALQYRDALQGAFPFPSRSVAPNDEEPAEWSISVVSSPDGARLDDPERQFILTKVHGGAFKVLARSTAGPRLGEQLANVRRSNPDVTLARALTAIHLRESETSESKCPQIRGLGRDLERLSIPVLPQNPLVIHGTGFYVRLRTKMSLEDRILMLVSDDKNPLSRWIAKTEAAVIECTN